jgi:hypothetical protein
MYASPNPFAEFHQAGMEALIELAQTKRAAVTSGIADADAKSSKRRRTTSKTNRDSKDSKGSSQARKGTKRKAA